MHRRMNHYIVLLVNFILANHALLGATIASSRKEQEGDSMREEDLTDSLPPVSNLKCSRREQQATYQCSFDLTLGDQDTGGEYIPKTGIEGSQHEKNEAHCIWIEDSKIDTRHKVCISVSNNRPQTLTYPPTDDHIRQASSTVGKSDLRNVKDFIYRTKKVPLQLHIGAVVYPFPSNTSNSDLMVVAINQLFEDLRFLETSSFYMDSSTLYRSKHNAASKVPSSWIEEEWILYDNVAISLMQLASAHIQEATTSSEIRHNEQNELAQKLGFIEDSEPLDLWTITEKHHLDRAENAYSVAEEFYDSLEDQIVTKQNRLMWLQNRALLASLWGDLYYYSFMENNRAIDLYNQSEALYERALLELRDNPLTSSYTDDESMLLLDLASIRVRLGTTFRAQAYPFFVDPTSGTKENQASDPTYGMDEVVTEFLSGIDDKTMDKQSWLYNKILWTHFRNTGDEGGDSTQRMNPIANIINIALDKFESAVTIYRQYINVVSKSYQRSPTKSLAHALDLLAETYSMEANHTHAILGWEEARNIYQNMLIPSFDSTSAPHDNNIFSQDDSLENLFSTLVHILLGLSDSYFLVGRYDSSIERYREAMEHLKTHGNRVDPNRGKVQPLMTTDDNLSYYLQTLDEYHETIRGLRTGTVLQDSDIYDFSYEANLHLTIGSIYLANYRSIDAEKYFVQAVHLYETSTDSDVLTDVTDAYLKLSSAQYMNKKYFASAQSYAKALNLYKTVLGDGVSALRLSEKVHKFGTLVSERASRVMNVNEIDDSDQFGKAQRVLNLNHVIGFLQNASSSILETREDI